MSRVINVEDKETSSLTDPDEYYAIIQNRCITHEYTYIIKKKRIK